MVYSIMAYIFLSLIVIVIISVVRIVVQLLSTLKCVILWVIFLLTVRKRLRASKTHCSNTFNSSLLLCSALLSLSFSFFLPLFVTLTLPYSFLSSLPHPSLSPLLAAQILTVPLLYQHLQDLNVFSKSIIIIFIKPNNDFVDYFNKIQIDVHCYFFSLYCRGECRYEDNSNTTRCVSLCEIAGYEQCQCTGIIMWQEFYCDNLVIIKY